jgi:hypothetical protein
MQGKRGFEMSFAWIFAIIVGAVILFLAIYAATQFIDVAKHRQYTEAAASISILLDPLETGIASATGSIIRFDKETQTHYNCYAPTLMDVFGKQTISFSEKSGFGQEWREPGGEITIRNKFIFANAVEQGENLYLFSKPFYTGFKVNDLIFASASEYCFIATPNIILEEIEQISLKNINLTNSIDECSEDSKKICFASGSSGCDVQVYSVDGYETGVVSKDGVEVTYVGALIYGAIFSNPVMYECNIQRLGAKINELGRVYSGKIEIVKLKDCGTAIAPELNSIISASSSIESSVDLLGIYTLAKLMDEKEDEALCKIYR